MKAKEYLRRFYEDFDVLKGLRKHYYRDLSEMAEDLQLTSTLTGEDPPTRYELALLEEDPFKAKSSTLVHYAMILSQRVVFYGTTPTSRKIKQPKKLAIKRTHKSKKLRQVATLNPEVAKLILDGELKLKNATVHAEGSDGKVYTVRVSSTYVSMFELEITSMMRRICRIREELNESP